MTTLVRGNKIAKAIKNELKEIVSEYSQEMIFHIVYAGSDPVIDNYLQYKQNFAQDIGIAIELHRFPESISHEELKREVEGIAGRRQAMIIQLPLPQHIQQQDILDLVPSHYDVDVLSTESREIFEEGKQHMLPPVTASIVEVLQHYDVDMKDKEILVVGNGRLVGMPMITWLDQQQQPYALINKETDSVVRKQLLQEADIIISGAGVPHMINTDDVKDGVVIIDAGTSEEGSVIHGDVHPQVKEKASLFTPVPGGIGPLTIAMLYRNVVDSYHHD